MSDIPILFRPEMREAIFDDRKTCTRRVDKKLFKINLEPDNWGKPFYNHATGLWEFPHKKENDIMEVKIKHKVGDRLWVKEPYAFGGNGVFYSDSMDGTVKVAWHNAMFMPKKYARIWLEIVKIKIERLQKISTRNIIKEGCDRHVLDKYEWWCTLWNSINDKPKPVYRVYKGDRYIAHYVSYPWESIQAVIKHKNKKWYVYGNPYIKVIEFAREF